MKDLHGRSGALLRGLCFLSSHVPTVPGSDLRGLKIRGLLVSTLLSATSLHRAKDFSSFPVYHAIPVWGLFF